MSSTWDYENSLEDDDNLDGIESLMNEQSDDDTNSRSDNDPESSEDERDEAELLEDEENYRRFVHSVFFDDDARSANSFNDEDDEEYKPDEAGEVDDDEYYVERGRKLDKVQDKELQGLVNECWQTIAGEAPILPSSLAENDSLDEIPNLEESKEAEITAAEDTLSPSKKRKLLSPSKTAKSKAQKVGDDPASPKPVADLLAASEGLGADDVLESPSKSVRSGGKSSKAGSVPAGGAPGGGQSVLSSLVSQMFSGEKPFEVCVEGMPVDAIRKLVARQMSMATQLLVQILLQADEKSECFTTAYTSLMELSNLRDTALKKAKLIQMNMNNVAVIHTYTRDKQRLKRLKAGRGGGGGGGEYHDDSSVASSVVVPSSHQDQDLEEEAVDTIMGLRSLVSQDGNVFQSEDERSVEGGGRTTTQVTDRRLTRSGMSAMMAASARSTSVFDIPALSKVNALFAMIDAARQEMKQERASLAEREGPAAATSAASEEASGASGDGATVATATPTPSSSTSSSSSKETAKDTPKDAAAKARGKFFASSAAQVARVMTRSKMRVWSCLQPRSNYPLTPAVLEDIIRTDPTSLTGRTKFTPAEDDLLLRGIITLGENNWARVKTSFLPSKEAQLLQFRFSNMTSLTAKDKGDNKFKRYQRLEVEYRNRDVKWSHEEELDLLRGFQTFGERWPLISIFFLPNRKRREIKQKWQQLQKVWQKGFQIHQMYRQGGQTELTDSMRAFLMEVNATGRSSVAGANGNGANGGSSGSSSSSGLSSGAAQRVYQNASALYSTNPALPPKHPAQQQEQQQQQARQPSLSMDAFINQHAAYSGQPAPAVSYPMMNPPLQLPARNGAPPGRRVAPAAFPTAQQPAAVPEAQPAIGSFTESGLTNLDFSLDGFNSNSGVPQRIIDMTGANTAANTGFAAQSFGGMAPARLSTVSAVRGLELGPPLLDNNRVPVPRGAISYAPVDRNRTVAPDPTPFVGSVVSSSSAGALRPPSANPFSANSLFAAHQSAQPSIAPPPPSAGHRATPSSDSSSRDFLSSPEGFSHLLEPTKINILKTKPKKAKAATTASVAAIAASPPEDSLDGLSRIPGFSDSIIEIIPSVRPAAAKKAPAKEKPPRAAAAKVAAKGKRAKSSSSSSSNLDLGGDSLLLPGGTDTISGLLHLPFDANAADSAWGIAGLNSSAVANAFDEQSMAHRPSAASNAAIAAGSGTIPFDDGLYSNLMQLGGLSNLMAPSMLLSPARATRSGRPLAATTPGRELERKTSLPRGSSGVADDSVFSPPTARLGHANNIKRKLSTSKSLMAAFADGAPAAVAETGKSSSSSNGSEVLSPSKKIKKGGLFASVMANVKK